MTSEILRLLMAMAMIESKSGTERLNKEENAYGLYHCRSGALHDVNARYNTAITLQDVMFDDDVAAFVVLAYGKMYGASTPEQYARIWNGGPKGHRIPATLDYWERCRNLMEDMK